MKKYFMKGTDKEVQFGERINVKSARNKEGSLYVTNIDCNFTPDLVDALIYNDIIEEREIEEESKEIDVDALLKETLVAVHSYLDQIDKYTDDMNAAFAAMSKRMDKLEKSITALEKAMPATVKNAKGK